MSLTSPSGAPLPRHTARLCFSVSVHFLKAAALQALSVPETLTSKLFFVSQSTPPPKKQSKTWLPYISSSQRNVQFCTVGSSHFPPPSCRVSFLAGTASRTHTHAHLDTHTLSHTEGSFIPPPRRRNCRLCGGCRRVAYTVVAGVCVCVCLRAHATSAVGSASEGACVEAGAGCMSAGRHMDAELAGCCSAHQV